MLRGLLVVLLLGGIGFVILRWATSGDTPQIVTEGGNKEAAQKDSRETSRPRNVASNSGEAFALRARDSDNLPAPLVIPDVRATPVYTQDVSAERQGKLLVLGKEITKAEYDQLDENKRYEIKVSFVAYFSDDDRKWYRWSGAETIQPEKVKVVEETRYFRRMEKGDEFKKGDLLGLLDTSLAIAELGIKISKMDSSEAKRRAAVAFKKEAETSYQILVDQKRRTPGSVSEEELRRAALTAQRYREEEVSEEQNVKVAKAELIQSRRLLQMHELRATISGKVKEVLKNPGEAVKEQELLVRLQNVEALRVEGFVDLQEARKLRKGMPVIVEPVQPEAPVELLRGHIQDVNAVAVTPGKEPWIISGGEDRCARVWGRKPLSTLDARLVWKELWTLRHPASVRAVACTGVAAKKSLAATGTADGVVRLWDLKDLEKKPRELTKQHNGTINALAFSADGELCVSAGDDKSFCIWNTGSGELVERVPDAHRGAVTSVQFTADGKLLTAGRDNTLTVWNLEKNGKVKSRATEFDRRSGHVDQLGVSVDGKFVLFDQGRQLQVLSIEAGKIEGVLRNTASSNFTTAAWFSPDGQTIVTIGAADNRLQLWRNPLNARDRQTRGRAAELRQYVWPDSPTTCAAFAPEAPFLVTATRDRQVLIWALPSAEEIVERPANAELIHIDDFLEANARQIRIVAEIRRKTESLKPGGTATLVIYPK